MNGQIECHFKDKYTFKVSVSMVKMLLGFMQCTRSAEETL